MRKILEWTMVRIALAYAAIYFLWGSTFLAIRVAVTGFPPLLMMAVRALCSGAILLLIGIRRGGQLPTRRQLGSPMVSGLLLFLGGHGALAWGEVRLPSGMAALLMALIPLWVAILDSIQARRIPRGLTLMGLVMGISGTMLLADPRELTLHGTAAPAGAGAVLFGAFSWAVGTVHVSRHDWTDDSDLSAGSNLVAGGLGLLVVGLLMGERVRWSGMRVQTILAVVYLILFGTIVAYRSYVWLLKREPATRVASYAYVNPVVAVLLGWWLGEESITRRTLAAGLLTVIGITSVVTSGSATDRVPDPTKGA